MPAKPVVFSDIDYTIVFDSILAPATEALIRQVRERAHFILVTARSLKECASLPPIPNDGLVTENGAAVYVRHGDREVLDEDWDRRMVARQEALEGFWDELIALGWRVNKKLHAFSACIEASGKSPADVEWAQEHLPAGLQLHFSRNTAGRYIEVFPVEAGKDKAVFRVCEDLGVPASQTFGLGDSSNDMDMLRVVGRPLAPGNCHPDVRALVIARGGYVSSLEGHEAAQDLLRLALRQLIGAVSRL